MTSTRRPPLHIYQDPPAGQPQPVAKPSSSQPKKLQPSPMPLQPIRNVAATNNRDIALSPTVMGSCRQSPIKHPRRRSSGHHDRSRLDFIPISAPKAASFPTDSPAKKPQNIRPQPRPMPPTRMPLFTTFPSVPEKMYPPTNPTTRSQSSVGVTTPPSALKTPAKRSSSSVDPETSKDRPSKKLKREESVAVHIPEPHEMPPVEDDGSKPPYSYAILIGMAILRATNRRLTLAQIYKWISDNFSYYRAGDFGWQNSIRHNLSLHKAFVKQERPKDDPGKGHYWVIEPGMEAQFLKDRPFRKAAVMSMIPSPHPSISLDQPEVPAKPDAPPAEINYMPPPARRASTSHNPDLSSDATLPASDPALQDDTSDDHDNVRFAPPLDTSPLQAIRSSPPVAPRTFHRAATPPTPSRPATSASTAAPRPKPRKTAAMNDSGYYSSLESSALRPRKNGHILTSDLDIDPPRIKRGRAEEEIARIRSSSHEISPMRLRTFRDTTGQLVGSSPLRNQYLPPDAGPLTPAIKFKKPAQPPPSLSPNTNLQNHRRKIQQMVNSPIKRLGIMEEIQPWSPSFTLNDEPFTQNDSIQVPLDLFSEQFPANVSTPNYGSPEKRSARRDRFNVTSGVLADITAIGPNTRLNTPLTQSSKARAAALKFYESPCKKSDPDRYIDMSHDDLFSFNLFNEEGAGDVDGVDLLQGFEKIGQSGKDGHSPKQLFGKGSSRLGPKGSKGSKGQSLF